MYIICFIYVHGNKHFSFDMIEFSAKKLNQNALKKKIFVDFWCIEEG